MKAQIVRGDEGSFILVEPAPERDVTAGLWAVFDKDTPSETNRAYMSLHKGQTLYELPDESERKVMSVFIASWAERPKT